VKGSDEGECVGMRRREASYEATHQTKGARRHHHSIIGALSWYGAGTAGGVGLSCSPDHVL